MSTALITGASVGIGKAFAEELASRKINLVLVARSQAKLNLLAQQLQEYYQIKVNVLVQDLTEPGAVQSVFEAVQNKGLTIDLLINNAGFGDYGDFAERDREKQLKMIQLNILSLVDFTHKFLPQMRQRRSGSIINIASIAAFQSLPYMSVYAATKAFVLSFSEAIWAENRDYGVRVLCVCPGPTESEFFKVAQFPNSFVAKQGNSYTTPEQVVKESLEALEKGQSHVITGGLSNQIIANVPRLFPRETLVSLVEKQFKA